jgi:hypothetical protein
MIDANQVSWLRTRSAAERQCAVAALTPVAAAIHETLAVAYERRLAEIAEAGDAGPSSRTGN